MAGPSYTYYATVPQGATQFNLTQPEILSNFQAIYELFAVNHVNLNVPDDFGKHNFCTLPSQSTPPSTNAIEIALYTATASTMYGYELYWRYPNNGSINQFTDESNSLPPGSSISQTIVFPNGFVLCYGQIAGSTNPFKYLNSIGGSENPPFKYNPFAVVSPISGSYEYFPQWGATEINQTGFKPNIIVNNFWGFVAMGF